MRVLPQPWYVCILFALPICDSTIEVGKTYRLRVARESHDQPAGWYLDAHRSLEFDRESASETRVSAHEETNAQWAGEWILEEGTSSDRYRIKLMSNHQGQEEGWYLGAIGRDASSAWVVVQPSFASEWLFGELAGVIIGDVTTATYTMREAASGWYLAAHRDSATLSRSARSTYVTSTSSTNASTISQWLLEPICTPFCAYDASEGGCHVSRTYTAEVVRVLQGGSWQGITDHLEDCEAQGKISVDACHQTAGCEIDSSGRCAATAPWSMEALAALPENSGIGIGGEEFPKHQKCGLVGQFLNLTVFCASNNSNTSLEVDADTCTARNAGGSHQCFWNEAVGTCEASPTAIKRFLLANFREELGYVSLKRLRCTAQSGASTCDGDCEWSEGHCALHPSRSLLAVLGQACPLSHFFKRQLECAGAATQAACTSIWGVGGLAQCRWTGTSCEAYTMSLEIDILPSLGLELSVQRRLTQGSRECRAMTDELECTATCAPTVTPEPLSDASSQLSRSFYVTLMILLPLAPLW
jgi:hypothetical protein